MLCLSAPNKATKVMLSMRELDIQVKFFEGEPCDFFFITSLSQHLEQNEGTTSNGSKLCERQWCHTAVPTLRIEGPYVTDW
jgi:hypothetical protein